MRGKPLEFIDIVGYAQPLYLHKETYETMMFHVISILKVVATFEQSTHTTIETSPSHCDAIYVALAEMSYTVAKSKNQIKTTKEDYIAFACGYFKDLVDADVMDCFEEEIPVENTSFH